MNRFTIHYCGESLEIEIGIDGYLPTTAYTIAYSGGTLEVPYSGCVQTIAFIDIGDEMSDITYSIDSTNHKIIFTIQPSRSLDERDFNIRVFWCTNTYTDMVITQDAHDYSGSYKVCGYTSNYEVFAVPCNGNSTLSRSEVTTYMSPFSAVTSITIGDCVEDIGTSAFTSFNNLDMGATVYGVNVKTIGDYAFYGVKGVNNLRIPSGITTIGNYAFGYPNTRSYWNVYIPSATTNIGSQSFLADFHYWQNYFIVDSGNTVYDGIGGYPRSANTGMLYNKQTHTVIRGTAINLNNWKFCPTGITTIGDSAFENVDVGGSATNMPYSITTIGNRAFYNCGFSSEYPLVIPSGVTTIGDEAFAHNEWYLPTPTDNYILVYPTTPPTLGSNAISNTRTEYGLPFIYVPSQSVNAYKTASGWSTYASKIEAMPQNLWDAYKKGVDNI